MRELIVMLGLCLVLTAAAFAENSRPMPLNTGGNLTSVPSGKRATNIAPGTVTSITTFTGTSTSVTTVSDPRSPSGITGPRSMPEEPSKPTGFR